MKVVAGCLAALGDSSVRVSVGWGASAEKSGMTAVVNRGATMNVDPPPPTALARFRVACAGVDTP